MNCIMAFAKIASSGGVEVTFSDVMSRMRDRTSRRSVLRITLLLAREGNWQGNLFQVGYELVQVKHRNSSNTGVLQTGLERRGTKTEG